MHDFFDRDGVPFQLLQKGLHYYNYRKGGRVFVMGYEAIVGGLGEHKFGRAF